MEELPMISKVKIKEIKIIKPPLKWLSVAALPPLLMQKDQIVKERSWMNHRDKKDMEINLKAKWTWPIIKANQGNKRINKRQQQIQVKSSFIFLLMEVI
jgi:hypothetical protein